MEAKELHVGNYLLYNGKPYRVIQVNGVIGDSWMLENGEENNGGSKFFTLYFPKSNHYTNYHELCTNFHTDGR